MREDQFRTLIERGYDAVCLISADGTVLYASPASERVLGYSPEEMMGRTGFELVLPSQRAEAMRRLAQLNADPRRVQTIQVQVRRKNGAVIWTEVVGMNLLADPNVSAIVVNFRDITEHKRTEELLRASDRALSESEDRLRLAVESTELGTWDLNPQTGKLIWSNRCKEIFGLPTDTAVDFPAFLSLLHPEDRERTDLAVQRALDVHGKGEYEIQYRVVWPGGAVRWVHAKGRAHFAQHHGERRAVRFIGTVLDVTERREIEDALRESEESYRILAETAGVGILKIDEHSRILFVNSAAAQMFGYSRAELLGRPLTALMPARLRAIHETGMANYLASGQRRLVWDSVEMPGLHSSGREFPVELSFGEFMQEARRTFTGIARDVSERKHAERRTAAQHLVTRVLSEYSTLAEIAPRILEVLGDQLEWTVGALWTPDNRGEHLRCVECWNHPSHPLPRFRDRNTELQFSRGEGLPGRVWGAGKAIWIPEIAQSDSFQRQPLALQEGLRSGAVFPLLRGAAVVGVMEFFSLHHREQDEEMLRTMELVGSQIGQFLERKGLEEQLHHRQRLEGLGILAGGIAHDFNNLLTGILGNASLAFDALPADNPARAYLSELVSATESAAHLTRQLLAYAGKGRFLIEPLNLSELTRSVSALIQRSIPGNVEFRLDLASGLPAVEGDASQIQQVVMNLVINGAEAVGENRKGYVTLTTGSVDLDETYLRGSIASGEVAPGRYVFLEVADTGDGMSEEILGRIFDPFFTTKFAGRGLGLAAVMGIVRGHRGALRVVSAPGHGTTFRVLFPASGRVVKKVRASRAASLPLNGAGVILVVDDEEMVRRTATNALESYGYTVRTAAAGREALDIFQRDSRDVKLVLLDLTMPGMNGEETLRELHAIAPDLPVVLSSGYNENEATRRFSGKGLAGFLQKPYTAARLAEKVKAILGKAGVSGA